MCRKLICLTSFVLVLALAGTASADQWDITVPDAGFDDHVLNNVGDWIYIGDGSYTGVWKSLFAENGAWIDYNYYANDGDLPALSGNNKAYGTYTADDYIYQILDETFIEGGTYTLSVWVGLAWSDYDDYWSLYFTGEDYTNNLIETRGSAPVGSWGQVSLVYTATATDAGKKIGIKMKGAEYVTFEDVTLSYDAGAEPGVTIPVGWWQFEGNASDSSGNGYDGILSADPDPVPVWTTDPERGNVLEFMPGLDYVDCGPGVSAGQDLTVALWIKPADVELMRPISCFDGDDYSENPGWFLMLRHDDWGEPPQIPPNAWFRMTGTEGEWNSGDLWINECWAPGEWVHMAFTFDEATDTLSGYINGELAGVTVVPEGRSVASDTNPLIMGHGGGVEQYEGLMDDVYIYDVVLTDAEIWNLVYPITIPVPNGDFEEIYKPGSTTITVTDLGGWVDGVGPNTPLDSGVATFSDGTTGDSVDVPGWIGAPGWLGNGKWEGIEENRNRQCAFNMDSGDASVYALGANGGNWGAPNGEIAVSAAPLAEIEGGLSYTFSVRMRTVNSSNPPLPLVWDLLADGSVLTPTSSVAPAMTTEFQSFSKTYDAASLSGHLGKSLTIQLGVGSPSPSGTQMKYDNVSLSYVPEPAVSLTEDFDSLAVGSNMHDVDGWEGWFGDAQWAAQVTDVVAYSGTNSLEIVGNRDDLVPNWPQQTTGKWTLSVMQYCPSDKQTTGLVYFGPLTEYDGAAETVGWIGEFMANFETGKAYCNADQAIQVDLVYDDWAELRLEVDLDAQEADFYYNDVFLSTQPAPSIAGVDIWPDENIVGIYFDDFRFEAAE